MAVARAQLESFSPATGELVGVVPRADAAAVRAAVDDAARVQPYWAALPLADRARYMRRAAQVAIDAMGDLGQLIAREQGRPIAEAASVELLPTVDALHWIADHGPRLLRDERVSARQLWLLGKHHRHLREPLGVIAIVSSAASPWTGPFLQAAIALMCGNAVVLKPAPETALVGARVERVLGRAGVPEGLIRVVHGGAETGEALVASSGVAKVFFSGSPLAGRRVRTACARDGTPAVLELGGKDAQLVLADARLDHTVAGTLWAAFAGAGQSAAAVERVYVDRAVAEPFLARLVEGARALRVGDPRVAGTEVGPLVSTERVERVRALVEEAVAAGATLHCGGPLAPAGLEAGAFFAPAILTGVTQTMRLAREPVPGPVLTLHVVDSEEEAVRRANDSEWGLGASVWSADRARGERIARRLEAGMAWINDHRYTLGAAQFAWGGTKGSGSGRVHGEPGFRECVQIKLLASDDARLRRPWWLPHQGSLAGASKATAGLLYGRDADRVPALRAGARPLARIVRQVVRGALRR